MYAVLYGNILPYSSGVRPFGVSLLICGWDDDRPFLFQCDPSVSQLSIVIPYHVFTYRVHIFRGRQLQWVRIILTEKLFWKRGKQFLYLNLSDYINFVRYNEDLELEDAIHTTILTLKVSNWDE